VSPSGMSDYALPGTSSGFLHYVHDDVREDQIQIIETTDVSNNVTTNNGENFLQTPTSMEGNSAQENNLFDLSIKYPNSHLQQGIF